MLLLIFIFASLARTVASHNLVVGAIDFGTTYSGWACSFLHEFMSDPTKATVKQWYSGSGSLTTEKTPTTVLIQPDGVTLEAFGYEAENRYRELVDAGKHRQYFYFKKFKMVLNKKIEERFDRYMTLEDEMGQSLPAIDVFALAVNYLKNDMLQNIKYRLTGSFRESDVHWVLTVPAIWTDRAKQFMREAANKANIIDEKLTIALEPEAASIYCRNLPLQATVEESVVSVATFKPGMQYLILDAGGGTIDLTVHEVDKMGGVKEIRAASGGGWGGTMVDKAFENILLELFTKNVYEDFKLEDTEDWLDLWREFEMKKRAMTPFRVADVNMKLPVSFINLYQHISNESLSECLAHSRFASDIKVFADKLKFSSKLFTSLFDSSLEKTVEYVKSILSGTNVQTILMVGGFSESPMLEQAVVNAFSDMDVIIPRDASSAILRGALIYGHSPDSVTERILKYTYGVQVTPAFIEGTHPESKRIKTEEGYRCINVFDKHVEKNQLVKVGEEQVAQLYTPVYRWQQQVSISVFASELKTPQYTDDEGCTFLGTLILEFATPEESMDRIVKVYMKFSGTEIIVNAKDVWSGLGTKASIDFLG